MSTIKLLVSTKMTFVLLLAFAGAMAAATFIENDYGTAIARAEVYEAWWFELLMAWMAVNFLAHIPQYKLLGKDKWPVGLFHLAFIVILLGAGITRFFGREGTVHIREGQTASHFITSEQYLRLNLEGEVLTDRELALHTRKFEPLVFTLPVQSGFSRLVLEDHIRYATESLVPGHDTLIGLAVVASGQNREDFYLKPGEAIRFGETLLATYPMPDADIQLFRDGNQWKILARQPMQLVDMGTQKMGLLETGTPQNLQKHTLHQLETGAFMVKDIYEGQQLAYVAGEPGPEKGTGLEVLRFSIWDEKGQKVQEGFYPIDYRSEKWQGMQVNGKQLTLAFGPKAVPLPFGLRLDRFDLERYPGSQSPSSYASEVTVIDADGSFPYRIFMNHVLDHKGYRFYQASYDTDERGTVLSVNQDRPGTWVTYFGYTLLGVAMFGTFFARGSRFTLLSRKLNTLQKAAVTLAVLLVATGSGLQAQSLPVVPEVQASAYGRLVVQDLDGRMKPLNTLAREIVRKLTGSSHITLELNGQPLRLNPEQFLLAAQLDPLTLSQLPLLKTDAEKLPMVFEALGVAPAEKLAFAHFVDADGKYLLHELVEAANRLKPAERHESDKALLKLDERFNICYAVLIGDFLRLFPDKEDALNTWYTSLQYARVTQEEDANFVKNITTMYLSGLMKGLETDNWESAEEVLGYMAFYQQKAGAAVYPDETTLQAELHYNRLDLGNKLFGIFWLLGLFMMCLAVARMFRKGGWLARAWHYGTLAAWLGMLAFTYHLALRWYVAKHPPWSDGFEMLLFVAWGVLLLGLLFARKSRFTVPVGLAFSGTLLFVAFLDWLNPEITNLMPVLRSYWLKIHVAVIVGSYAPLALAAVLALLMLVLLVTKPERPGASWWRSMQELSLVNEKAIAIGLFLLTIGTFLGGVWANESWGRYWAWDPKETWALISIIVYALVLHLRLVPAFKNALVYHLASLWAFSAIIMTSYGVNYYLSGLHSYAKGDPVPVPGWVYYTVALLAAVSLAATWKYFQLSKLEKQVLACERSAEAAEKAAMHGERVRA
jgi:cytochrome c-type biogenesis protein CcsB